MSGKDPERVEMLRRMIRIRGFEDEVAECMKRGEIVGALHSSVGQEASAVGACMGIAPDDYITGYHRSHGHPIAKGAKLPALMAEMFGRKTGVCKGMGGSMHLADFSVGSLGEAAIVGGGLPIAVGAAFASQYLEDPRICLAFFGDGASNNGTFHESLNLGAVWKLPVVFFCENNNYAVTVPFAKTSAVPNVADRATAYGIPGVIVDGQDVEAVRTVVRTAAERARAGGGPSLIEAKTYRYTGHSLRVGLTLTDRPEEEVAAWMARDPITLYSRKLIDEGVLTDDDLGSLTAEVESEVGAAVEFARSSPFPEVADLEVLMYMDSTGMPMRGRW